MVHLRKKSGNSFKTNKGKSKSKPANNDPNIVKLTKEDVNKFKIRTANVHDPILDAVQEAQPFEQAAVNNDRNILQYFTREDGTRVEKTDVFGNIITVPDISNPTRARDERPLDTLRGFEYSISGDPGWGQHLETPFYGFKVRPENYDILYSKNTVHNNGQLNTLLKEEQAILQLPNMDELFKQNERPKKSKWWSWKGKGKDKS